MWWFDLSKTIWFGNLWFYLDLIWISVIWFVIWPNDKLEPRPPRIRLGSLQRSPDRVGGLEGVCDRWIGSEKERGKEQREGMEKRGATWT